MNPDFAIVLNFKTTGDFDADFLVKTARNIDTRARNYGVEVNTQFIGQFAALCQ